MPAIPYKRITFFLMVFLFFSCADKNKPPVSEIKQDKPKKSADYENGKLIYRENCAKCHSFPEQIIDGSSLFQNLFERLPEPSQEYFITFVKDSRALERTGDEYVKKIKERYPAITIDHTYGEKLSDKNIQDIMLYIVVSNKTSTRSK